jgi:hypothetical protein
VLLILLVAGLSVWLWPKFSDLDTYRPEIISLLQVSTQRPVTVGHLAARLFPYPSLVARNVTLFYHDNPNRPLISTESLALRFYFVPILHRQFRPRVVSFEQPRLFLTRDTTSWAQILDTAPLIQGSSSTLTLSEQFPLERLEVVDGVMTFTDNVLVPSRQERMDQLNGFFSPSRHQGDLSGLAPSWGMPARFTLHIDQKAVYPYDLRLEGVRLKGFESYAPKWAAWLSGSITARLKIKNKSAIQFQVERLSLARLPGLLLKGVGNVTGERLSSTFEVLGTTGPMHGDIHALLRSDPLDIQASVMDYSPEVAARLTDISWITRLESPGYAHFTLERPHPDADIHWLVEGGSFTFSGTSLAVDQLRISGNSLRIDVQTGVQTHDGHATVLWSKQYKKEFSFLNVTASSISVSEILPVFNMPFVPEESTGILKTHAWENFHLTNVHMTARIYPHQSFILRKAVLTIEEAAVHLSGTFGLQGKGAPAHIDGAADGVPIEAFWNRFFRSHAYVTGTAGFEFQLDFPLVASWVEDLDGTLYVHSEKGVVKSFKTLYDVLAVTNLANYLTLHLPNLKEQGIPYETLSGHFTIADGVFTSKDVFMKTENSNIAAEGVIDMPGQELDATLRVQFFRLIEDILHAIPGLKWILNDQHKILLPIIVTLRGPWHDVKVE